MKTSAFHYWLRRRESARGVALCFRLGIAVALLLYVPIVAGADIVCEICRKSIAGKYIQVAGKNYCSRTCYSQTLPKCSQCRQPLSQNYLNAGSQYFCSKTCYERSLPACTICRKPISGKHSVLQGKHFCSKRCMDAFMPKCERCKQALYSSIVIGDHQYCTTCGSQPPCWKCQLPKALTYEFKDGRKLCRACTIGMIATEQQAAPLYTIARHEVKRITGFRSPTLPHLSLVGRDLLKKYAPPHLGLDSSQWGVYRREVTITTTRSVFRKTTEKVTAIKENIYILAGLDREEFISTAAHELTHDLLAETYPAVTRAPTWVEEGICQYVAAGVCLLNGWFDELKAIETAPDANYGGGYRYFKQKFGDADWNDVAQWLKSTDMDTLPEQPPER